MISETSIANRVFKILREVILVHVGVRLGDRDAVIDGERFIRALTEFASEVVLEVVGHAVKVIDADGCYLGVGVVALDFHLPDEFGRLIGAVVVGVEVRQKSVFKICFHGNDTVL